MLYHRGESGPVVVLVVALERRSDKEPSRRTRRARVKCVLNFRRCLGAAVPEIVILDTLTGDGQEICCCGVFASPGCCYVIISRSVNNITRCDRFIQYLK